MIISNLVASCLSLLNSWNVQPEIKAVVSLMPCEAQRDVIENTDAFIILSQNDPAWPKHPQTGTPAGAFTLYYPGSNRVEIWLRQECFALADVCAVDVAHEGFHAKNRKETKGGSGGTEWDAYHYALQVSSFISERARVYAYGLWRWWDDMLAICRDWGPSSSYCGAN